MSGTGYISLLPLGAALVVPAVAIAMVGGAVYVAGKAFSVAAEATEKAIEQARLNRMESKIGEYTAQLDQTSAELNREVERAIESCYDDYQKEISLVTDSFSTKHDLTAYMEMCNQAKQHLDKKIEEVRAENEEKRKKTSAAIIGKIKSELADKRNAVTDSIKAMSDDIAVREEKAKMIAQKTISEAQGVIESVRTGYGESKIAEELYDKLSQALERVRKDFSDGNFEASIIGAYAIIEQSVTRVDDLLKQEYDNAVRYNQCKAALEELKGLIEANRSISYTFEESETGETEIIEIEDFAMFYTGAFEKHEEVLKVFTKRLDERSFEGFTSEELVDVLMNIRKECAEFINSTDMAYQRLHNNLLRNQYADIIAASYEEMGFEEIESEEYEPIEKTILTFSNPDTQEVVRVTLSPEQCEAKKLGVAIEVESRDEDLDDERLETKRESQRQNVCNSIMDSTVGRRLQISANQSCRKETRNKNGF